MTSPAWYGRRDSNSHSLGPKPSAPPLSHTHLHIRLRRKDSNLRRAGQGRVSYRWTTPERSSLRKESNLRARAYEARLPPRSAAMQKRKAVTRKEETFPAARFWPPPSRARQSGIPTRGQVIVVPSAFTAGKR